MQMHAKGRKELHKAQESYKLVQKAKFQARYQYLKQKSIAEAELKKDIHQRKMEVEQEYLKYGIGSCLWM